MRGWRCRRREREEEERGRKRERVPRRIDGERGMRWRRKAVEEATKRGVRGTGCNLARAIGARRECAAGERERGGRGERGG